MSVAAHVLTTLHLILLTGFLAVTLLLLLVTAYNRWRVRRVLLSWQRGRFYGLPVWPAAFLGAVLLFFGGAFVTGQVLPLSVFVGYLAGGVFWFVAGLLSASVLVTEQGVLQNANQTDEAVAWEQIVDYFEVSAGRKQRYVFFYLDPSDVRRRLEVTVPRAQSASFGKIVREKLDRRFGMTAQQRMILSIFLFLDVAVVGCLMLLAIGAIQI